MPVYKVTFERTVVQTRVAFVFATFAETAVAMVEDDPDLCSTVLAEDVLSDATKMVEASTPAEAARTVCPEK